MPNIAVVLKSEVSRLVRKEVRQDLEDLKKALRAQRTENTAMKKQLAAVERTLAKLSATLSDSPKAVQATDAQPRAPGKRAPAPASNTDFRASFSPEGFAQLRKSWNLSAESMGSLVGASGQSVYKWERKGVMPRDKQLAQIWAIKDLTRDQALAQLAKLQG